jgi:hypothetical protein
MKGGNYMYEDQDQEDEQMFLTKKSGGNCSLCMVAFALTAERRPMALPCGHKVCKQCLI